MSIEANKISFTAPGSVANQVTDAFALQKSVSNQTAARENQQVETNSQDALKPKNFANDEGERHKALESKLIATNSALVIEKDPNGSGFIYKSIDRQTGEVVRLWPRQEIATALQALQDIDARGLMLDETA